MSDDSTRYAFVVSRMHGSRTSIREAEKHAQGTNRSARDRRRAFADARALALYLQPAGTLSEPRVVYPADHPKGGGDQPELDLVAAYDRHLKLHSARRYGRSHHLAYHLIVGVSPSYFEGSLDDRHDPDSEAVRTLMASAVEWAERDIGGVWHARYDVDEDGCGIVDVCCTPLRTDPRNGRKWISTRKPQAALSKKWRRPTGYGAFQDAWADYFTRRMGRTYQRGRPKEETGREHMIAEQYGEVMDEGRRLRRENAELRAERDAARAERDDAEKAHDRARREEEAARAAAEAARAAEAQAKAALDDARSALKATSERLKAMRRAAGIFARRARAFAVGLLRAASRPDLPPDPEPDAVGGLAVEAQSVAADMAHAAQPAVPRAEHDARIGKRVRDRLGRGGWEDARAEAPLYRLYAAEGSPDGGPDPYYDWRLDLAHSSGRRKALAERADVSGISTDDLKDCIRLARRIERRDGRYMSRRERSKAAERHLDGIKGASAGPPMDTRRRRGSAPAGFSR